LPQKIKCSHCEELLYNDEDLESPFEIMKKFNGLCPKCNNKLHFEVKNVKIVPKNIEEDSEE